MLNVKDREKIIRFTPISSAHSFLSLFVYGAKYDIKVTDDGYTVFDPQRGFLFPCGTEDYVKSELLRLRGCSVCMMGLKDAEKYKIEPLPDEASFEYVYDRVQQITLPGHAFSKVRAKLARFDRSCNAETRPITKDNIKDACYILERWTPQAGEGDSEGAACALDNFDKLALTGSITYIDGAPAGYVCGGEMTNDTYLLISAKQISDIQGLNISTKYEHYKTLPEHITYINTESDHGLPGVRMHKNDLRPVILNKMYKGVIK